MSVEDPIGKLNALAAEWALNSQRFETTEQLRDLFSNPKKYATLHGAHLDEALNRIVELFPRLSTAEREIATSRLSPSAQNALLRHAGSLSRRAVDERSPALVYQALVSLAVEGGSVDIRDSIVALRGLRDLMRVIGINVRTEFSAALTLVSKDAPLQLGTNLYREISQCI